MRQKGTVVVLLILCLTAIGSAYFFYMSARNEQARADAFKLELLDSRANRYEPVEYINRNYGFRLYLPAHWKGLDIQEEIITPTPYSKEVSQIVFLFNRPKEPLYGFTIGGSGNQGIAMIIAVYPKESYVKVHDKLAETARYVFEIEKAQGQDDAYSAQGMGFTQEQIAADFEFIKSSWQPYY